eukprot:986093-Pelagomonas_calceolata.AAC.1
MSKDAQVHGEWKTGMEPPGNRHWRVKEEDQRKHTLGEESKPGSTSLEYPLYLGDKLSCKSRQFSFWAPESVSGVPKAQLPFGATP